MKVDIMFPSNNSLNLNPNPNHNLTTLANPATPVNPITTTALLIPESPAPMDLADTQETKAHTITAHILPLINPKVDTPDLKADILNKVVILKEVKEVMVAILKAVMVAILKEVKADTLDHKVAKVDTLDLKEVRADTLDPREVKADTLDLKEVKVVMAKADTLKEAKAAMVKVDILKEETKISK
jgi:hypothetical protein